MGGELESVLGAGGIVQAGAWSHGLGALGKSREALGSHDGPVQGWGAVFQALGCLCRAGSSVAFTTRLSGLGGAFLSLPTPLLYQRKAADPSRFTNRGGNLLKEEKQRAKLQKTLSRVGPALAKDLWSH